jgi:hypothetical protein
MCKLLWNQDVAAGARLKPSGHLPSPEDGPQTLTRPVTGLRKCSPRSCPSGLASLSEVFEPSLDIRCSAPLGDTNARTLTTRAIHVPNFSPPKPLQNNEQSVTVYPKSEKRATRAPLFGRTHPPSLPIFRERATVSPSRAKEMVGAETQPALKRNRTVLVQTASRLVKRRPAAHPQSARGPESSSQRPLHRLTVSAFALI